MPIQGKQIFDDSLFKAYEDLRKLADYLNKSLQDNIQTMTGILKVQQEFQSKFTQARDFKELDNQIKSNNETQLKYTKTVEQAIKIEEDLKNLTNKQKDADYLLAKAKAEKAKYTKEVTDRVREENREQKEELGTIAKLKQINKELREEKLKLNLATKEGINRLREINKEINKNNSELEKTGSIADKTRGNIGKYFKDIVKGGLALAGINIGLNTLKDGFLKLINSMENTADDFAIMMGGMKEGANAFFRTIAQGDLSNLITNIKNAISAGREYAELMDKLEDKTNSYNIKEADFKKASMDLDKIYKDQTKTVDERIKAADELINREEKLGNDRTDLAKSAYDTELTIAKERTKLTENQIMNFLRNQDIMTERYEQAKIDALEVKDVTIKSWDEVMKTTSDDIIEIGDAMNNLTQEDREKIIKLYTEWKEQEVSAYENNKRLYSRRSSLSDEFKKTEEINIKDLDKIGEDFLNRYLTRENRSRDEHNRLVNIRLEKEKDAAEKLDEIGEQILQNYLDRENKKINSSSKTVDTQVEDNARMGLVSMETAQNVFNFSSSLVNRQIELTSRKYDNEIERAEKAGKDTTEIEKRKAKEIAELQRKQAIINKAAALFDIAINTQVALSKGAAMTGPLAVLYEPLVIASAALQAGIVLAEPLPEIPAFFKGKGKDSFEGIGLVGDAPGGRSTEIVKFPDHRNFLVDRPIPIFLPKGSEVIPEMNVQRELADLAARGETVLNYQTGLTDKKFEQIMRGIASEIRTVKDGTYINMTENSFKIHARKGNVLTEYRNKNFRHK